MKKIFVLDTSVLAYDPSSLYSFEDHDVILPITVLDELDKLKKGANEISKNCRLCIRTLDSLAMHGDIVSGIKLEGGGLLKIDTSTYGSIGDASYGDNKILACAHKLQQDNADAKVILVSKDINLRVRGKAFGLCVEDYEKDKIQTEELYTGLKVVVNDEMGSDLILNGDIYCKDYDLELNYNQFVLIKSSDGSNIVSGKMIGEKVEKVENLSPWGLALKNKEQMYAANLLLDPEIPLVSLIGKAGTGKTLLTIAAGLESLINKKLYSKLIVYRPVQVVGDGLGYLPGSLEEKLAPMMQAINDSFDFLVDSKSKKSKSNSGAVNQIKDYSSNKESWRDKLAQFSDRIQLDAITYVRGRSIPNAYMIVDESQNLSKEEVKTILTRASMGTKIVLTGDIEQIDNSYLDATNNGLTYVIEKFKNSPLAGHITLTKGERSALATEAAEIL